MKLFCVFLESNEPVTENTVYCIGSVSKHFTTTLLGQTLTNAGTKFLADLPCLDDVSKASQ